MTSKAELEERVADLERQQEKKEQDAAFMSLVGTIMAAVIVGSVGMVAWAVPLPGPWDEVIAVALVALAFIVVTLHAKSYLDTTEGDAS